MTGWLLDVMSRLLWRSLGQWAKKKETHLKQRNSTSCRWGIFPLLFGVEVFVSELWFSSEWESRFYKLPVSAEELELHRWFPHEKWRFIKLSYSPKKKKSSLKSFSSSLLSCCWESSWKFPDVIINLFAYEAFLPELPHSETKEEGENFCNEISPKTWQQ